MPQTYRQLKKHIAELQSQAESIKRSEVAGVIAQAKEAIRVYGLTRQDLFGDKAAVASKPAKKAKGPKAAARSAEAKYADGKGGFWVGRGKRPQWLNDLLKAGAKLEDFLAGKFSNDASDDTSAGTTKAAATKPAAKKVSAKAGAKTASRAKYQDDAGHSWSGFGPRPKWLKDGIAGGKTLEDFLV